METNRLAQILYHVRNRAFSYTLALVPDRKLAIEIMGQALTVFLFKEKKFLQELDNSELEPQKKYFNKFVLLSLSKEIYKISHTRFKLKKFSTVEYQSFYNLDLEERSAVYLSEKKVAIEEIKDIMNLENAELNQYLYRGRGKLAEKFDIKNLNILHQIEASL
jgi:hypothetical protein